MANQTTIRLRALEPTDLDCLYLWENNAELWQYGSAQAPMSRKQLWDYIQNYDADPFSAGQLRLMIETNNGIAVGCVDLFNVDNCNRRAEVGIMIAPNHQRCGYAGQSLELLKQYCRDRLGLHQLAATIACGNVASIATFKNAGFEQRALLPEWLRVGANSYADASLWMAVL